MVNQELRDYIARCRHAGQSDEQIAAALGQNGWEQADITAGLEEHPGAVPTPVNLPAVQYEQVAGPLVLLTLGVILPVAIIELFGYLTQRGLWLGPVTEIAAGIIGIVAACFALWFALSAAWYVSRTSEGVNAAMNHALRRIPSYLWIVILIELIVQFGNLLFVIPGIVFAVWFSFSVFVLSQEDARGMHALLKSKEYVRGRWWKVFGTLLALGIGFIIIMVVCLGAARITESRTVMLTAYTVLGILTLLYYPFALIRFYNLFARIKNEKGIVALPATGRTLFTVFASLGAVVVIAIICAGIFGARYSHNASRYDANYQQQQSMIPDPGYQPTIQTQ
jgi:hypothetical protein